MSTHFILSESLTQRNHIIDAHRQLILEIRKLEPEISKRAATRDPRWRELEEKRSALMSKIEPLIEEYWNWMPAVCLSQCPFCQQDLQRLFDPVDLNGFWWMDRTQRPAAEPENCGHFRLLLGAVNFNGLPAKGGLFECRPGPDLPYVIPRILKMPTMAAVISSIPMHCGYSAYPVCYYSQQPPAERSLTQSWARKEYHFTLKGGKPGRRGRRPLGEPRHSAGASPLAGWDIVDDSYDFALFPWLQKGKIRWYNESRLSPQDADPQMCPFLKLRGIAKPQILRHDELSYEPLDSVRGEW